MENIGIIISNICQSAGTERAVINLANAITELTDNAIFIISVYSTEQEQPFYAVNQKVGIIHLNYSEKKDALRRLSVYSALFKDLKKACIENKISVLIGTAHAYNIVISLLKNVIKFGCEHINYCACPKLFRLIRLIAYRKLDHVILLTNDDKKHYEFLGNEKPVVIPNIRSFFPTKTAELSSRKIISVGRLSMQKGYDILLQFADRLYNVIPDWQIEIYGAGEMKEFLCNEISRKHLDNFIHIMEPVHNIQQKMTDASLYLMTSRNEGLPMALLEAQACGLPIISFDCPEGPKDIIEDGVNGYLIPVGDINLMIDRIEQLARSVEKRKIIGSNARLHSENYSKETITEKWIRLIDESKSKRREKS